MAKREPSYVLILDGWRPVTILDENDTCSWYDGPCGGCAQCMMAQYAYSCPEMRCRKLTKLWELYDWVYSNAIWDIELLVLGVYKYGPIGYYKHRKQMNDFLSRF